MTTELTLIIIAALLFVLAVFYSFLYHNLRESIVTLKETAPTKEQGEAKWKYGRKCVMKFQDQIGKYIQDDGKELSLMIVKRKD